MSRRFVVAALVAAGLPLAAERGLAQLPFEGSATFKMTMSGQSMETKYYSNGKRTRQEMNMGGHQMVAIVDMAEAKTYTLMPERKQYMTLDLKEMGEMMKGMTEAMGDKKLDLSKAPKITPTGRKEAVLGYPCEHYLLQSEKTEVDFCVAKGLGNLGGMGGGGMGGGGAMAALYANPGYKQLVDMMKEGFFPLKFTVSEGGSVKMTSEATQITKGGVSADLLAIPSDYTEIKMPAGFGPKRP